MIDPGAPCPCGFGSPYGDCCGPLHAGALASTAERLMRSRYSAFALGSVDPSLGEYLVFSWHPDTVPADVVAANTAPGAENDREAFETVVFDGDVRWIRLLIDEVHAGGPFDDEGVVTFTAVARTAAGRFVQRERSRFLRVGPERRWVYVDGVALEGL